VSLICYPLVLFSCNEAVALPQTFGLLSREWLMNARSARPFASVALSYLTFRCLQLCCVEPRNVMIIRYSVFEPRCLDWLTELKCFTVLPVFVYVGTNFLKMHFFNSYFETGWFNVLTEAVLRVRSRVCWLELFISFKIRSNVSYLFSSNLSWDFLSEVYWPFLNSIWYNSCGKLYRCTTWRETRIKDFV
jgi:hypothetical protein